MPIDGLALIGFMEEAKAIAYLRERCIPSSPDDAMLAAEWAAAAGRLGDPIPRAGYPDIDDLQPEHSAYVQQLSQSQWQGPLYAPGSAWSIKVVSIAELLAFQFQVDLARPGRFTASLQPPIGIGHLLPICLPLMESQIPIRATATETSVMLRSPDLNLRLLNGGIMQNMAGIQFGTGLPHMQVVQFNGRCYLANGYHRMTGLQSLGATHVPCLFRVAANAAEFGINAIGTFGLPLLESANPPTCSHFCEQRAHRVSLRNSSRIIHVTWSDHVVMDE